MPLLRFTVLTDKVRDHTKTQTIRKPRKRPLREQDDLFIYAQEKLGKGRIIKIVKKRLEDLTLEDAQKDGFETVFDCREALMNMHDCDIHEEFDIITYHPHFKRTVIKEI